MKRVQDYFKQVDTNRLIACYIHKYDLKLSEILDNELTVGKLKKDINQTIRNYIEHLCSLPIIGDQKKYILFTFEKIRELGEPIDSLVCIEDLKEYGVGAPLYSYHFKSQTQIMSYFVSEDKYTQQNIIELLADVMSAASFFGFFGEHLEAERKRLDDAISETDVSKWIDEEEFWASLGWKREQCDETADALLQDVYKSRHAYDEYQKKKALIEIMSLLEN